MEWRCCSSRAVVSLSPWWQTGGRQGLQQLRVRCDFLAGLGSLLARVSLWAGSGRGSDCPGKEGPGTPRSLSLLGLINISQPTFRFWEHFSVFSFQMHRRELLGNSCSLNLLKTGSFLLIFVCCSNSWFHFSPAVFSQTKLANHRRHPGVVFVVSQQALSNGRSMKGFS